MTSRKRRAPRIVPVVPDAICATACAAALALLLFAVARPVATDDVWWHLAHGRAFAERGPWLAGDPLLFTAPRPAANASWLADVALAGVHELGGFTGLRLLHLALVGGILALAYRLLRRESGSWRLACVGLIAFATLSAYRAFQLRPHLATMLLALALYALALRPRAGPTASGIALGAGLMALWANLHAAFVLGPALVAATGIGVAVAAALDGRAPAPTERARLVRLVLLLALGSLATLANPSGFEQHLAWFAAGSRTPSLGGVVDEWSRLALFALPRETPPSAAGWLLVWGLLGATLALTARAVRERLARRGDRATAGDAGLDPALVALAWFGLAAACAAVRFLWLAIFPLLLAAQASRRARPEQRARLEAPHGPAALAAAGLLAAFAWIGPWPRIADGVPTRWSEYREPYAAWKYFADPIWLMRDAGLEGRLYNDYSVGGFAGFWLAPRIRTFIDGTLNLSHDAVLANGAIRERHGVRADESFAALLDRMGLDLFHGIRMPQAELSTAESYTTSHLERTPGWKPVFRNVRSALYLRDDARNAANLARVARFYADAGVFFDPQQGFEPGRVLRERRDWAVANGLVPADFDALERAAAAAGDARARDSAKGRVATWYALLGLYDAAIALDAEILARRPRELGPRRRRVWSLLRAGRVEEADHEAQPLAAADPLTRRIAELARESALAARAAGGAVPAPLEARIRRLPLLTAAQARAIASALPSPPAPPR